MLNVSGSMSTKTGRAPSLATEPAVAKNEKGVVMTSSPSPTPMAINAAMSASVPDDMPIACVNPEERFQLALEAVDFWPEDEALRVAHTGDGGEHIVAKRRELGLQVQERHVERPSHCGRGAPGGIEGRRHKLRILSY